MIDNLGHSTWVDAVDVMEAVLWGESLSLLLLGWLLLSKLVAAGSDSDVSWGLCTQIFSSVAGVGGTGQVPEGNLMSTGATLGIGEGLLIVNRCCSSCSTHRRDEFA